MAPATFLKLLQQFLSRSPANARKQKQTCLICSGMKVFLTPVSVNVCLIFLKENRFLRPVQLSGHPFICVFTADFGGGSTKQESTQFPILHSS